MIAAQLTQRRKQEKQAANLQRMLSIQRSRTSNSITDAEGLSLPQNNIPALPQKIYNTQMKRKQSKASSVMLSDYSRLAELDKRKDFKSAFCEKGSFDLEEAQKAIDQVATAKENFGQTSDIAHLPVNTLRILLGLALCNE